jgi:DNA-binding FadR family transcriptional regulator
VVSRVKTLHVSIAEAIIDQNAPLAARRMRGYLSGLKDWLKKRSRGPMVGPASGQSVAAQRAAT